VSRIIYLDGEFLPREEARISVDDRGFIFGDGVYEVTRALNGVLFEGEAHLQRLAYGLSGLEIQRGEELSTHNLLEVSHHLLAENELLDGHSTIYLQVTRGVAPRTHQFPVTDTQPTVYLAASRFIPPSVLHEQGATAITHPDLRWRRCDLKTVNLLPNVLAKQQAVKSGATEALLIREGIVTEGSHTNVFAVIGGELCTHPCSADILTGITRRIVLQLAEEAGLTVRDTPVLAQELGRAEELFLSGTTTDVMPITRLNGRAVAYGRPGEITRQLQSAYANRMATASPSSAGLPALTPSTTPTLSRAGVEAFPQSTGVMHVLPMER
jgi:D-alanine transaminase